MVRAKKRARLGKIVLYDPQISPLSGVDGIVLCLDVSVLLNSSVTERKSLADTLRLRILEVASTFQADIAVYLFLNNIDKLPGGETFLSLMNDELLAGGLGISMTHNERAEQFRCR